MINTVNNYPDRLVQINEFGGANQYYYTRILIRRLFAPPVNYRYLVQIIVRSGVFLWVLLWEIIWHATYSDQSGWLLTLFNRTDITCKNIQIYIYMINTVNNYTYRLAMVQLNEFWRANQYYYTRILIRRRLFALPADYWYLVQIIGSSGVFMWVLLWEIIWHATCSDQSG